MNNCKKHHYVYAFESRIEKYDIRLFNEGLTKSTLNRFNIGDRVAFYHCRDCGGLLLTEVLK